VADAPRLPPNERDSFAVGAALMNVRRLRDADRASIVAAIERGRRQAAGLRSSADVDTIAQLISLDGWRRRALGWMLARSIDVSPMFSLAELMTLGGGVSGVDLDAWGTTALSSRGCACTEFLPPGSWSWLAGRPQLSLMGSSVSDLNLQVAIVLNEMNLPAILERPVLAAAIEEFIYEVAPSDPGDWWTVTRSAHELSRQQVEDYVAAAAAVDGPLVPVDDAGLAIQP
jgi:hypothetical protein